MKLFTIAALFVTMSVAAEDPAGLWYDPDRPGHGLYISGDNGFGRSLTWYLHRHDGSSGFVISDENCAKFPCVVALHEPAAGPFGASYDRGFDLGDPVGSLEIHQHDDEFSVKYDLRGFYGEVCSQSSPGGLIFNGCVGRVKFTRLTY